MKKLLLLILSTMSFSVLAQPWSSNGVCDFVDGQQWNNGGAKGCACTWYSVENGDTILNCAFGDCGQSDLLECVYDCNGHNGNTTDMVARECDGTASPICWFNGGGGSAGELFCQGIALPVELIGFEAFPRNGYNELSWATISEYNASHYLVQRSSDGFNYMTFATLPAAGTSTETLHYRAIDLTPKPIINYYRLVQYDFDGVYEIYEVVTVDNRSKDDRIVKKINLLGQSVDESYKGLVIIYYDNGEIEKVIQ